MVEVTQVAALQGHLYFGGRPFPCGILRSLEIITYTIGDE